MSYPVWRAPQQRGFDPLSELYALRAELSRMVGSALTGQRTFADVDVEEAENGWVVTARLPGVAPEEVAVEVDDRELCIRARTEAEVSGDDGSGDRAQRRSFEYRMSIPGEVDPDAVDATMDHGLLTVRLPRSTRSRRRQVAVGRRAVDNGGSAATGPPGGQGESAQEQPAPSAPGDAVRTEAEG